MRDLGLRHLRSNLRVEPLRSSPRESGGEAGVVAVDVVVGDRSPDWTGEDVPACVRARGREFANKYLNVVPTITVPAGTPMKIFIEDDIYVRPWARVDDTIYPSARAH